MGAALVLLLVGLGALAAGVLIGRYYVPDDRQLRRTARHSKAYMRALSHLIARDHDTVVTELRGVVEENIEDVEPYFALGAMFRSRGENERAIRVHQALALRERDRRKLRQRAMHELGLDFRAAGMPRRATKAMEEVLLEEPGHEGALRVLAALYEEQARFNEAAGLWQRIGKRRNENTTEREHHLLVAAAQAALGRDDPDSAKQLLKAAQRLHETAHWYAAAAELAAARGNHRGARERLKQALIADPALVPHLLPGLVAAEQGIAATETKPGRARTANPHDDLDDDDEADNAVPADGTPEVTASGATLISGTTALVSGSHAAAARPANAGDDAAALAVQPVVDPDASGSNLTAVASSALRRVATPPGGVPIRRADATAPGTRRTATPPEGLPLVQARPAQTISERVLAVLGEVEQHTGQRLELALIRAQLLPPTDAIARAALAKELVEKFPEALAARVATARLALDSGDATVVKQALEVFVADAGALSWALRGRWQCAQCGHRPGPFSWRCGQCRRWGTLRMETGIEPPPTPRDRRATPRPVRPDGLLGAPPDESLPQPTLDAGLSDEELARAGVRRSLLGRVGGWVSNAWRRDKKR